MKSAVRLVALAATMMVASSLIGEVLGTGKLICHPQISKNNPEPLNTKSVEKVSMDFFGYIFQHTIT